MTLLKQSESPESPYLFKLEECDRFKGLLDVRFGMDEQQNALTTMRVCVRYFNFCESMCQMWMCIFGMDKQRNALTAMGVFIRYFNYCQSICQRWMQKCVSYCESVCQKQMHTCVNYCESVHQVWMQQHATCIIWSDLMIRYNRKDNTRISSSDTTERTINILECVEAPRINQHACKNKGWSRGWNHSPHSLACATPIADVYYTIILLPHSTLIQQTKSFPLGNIPRLLHLTMQTEKNLHCKCVLNYYTPPKQYTFTTDKLGRRGPGWRSTQSQSHHIYVSKRGNQPNSLAEGDLLRYLAAAYKVRSTSTRTAGCECAQAPVGTEADLKERCTNSRSVQAPKPL